MTNQQLDVLSGVAMTAFPLTLLAHDLFADGYARSGHLTGLLLAWLFAATFLSLARRLWPHRPRTTLVLGGFAMFGLTGSIQIFTYRLLEGAFNHSEHFLSTAAPVVPFIFFPGLGTPLTLLAFALVLWRVERNRAWLIVAAGAVLFPLGRIAFGAPVIVASDLFLLPGLSWNGGLMARRSLAVQAA